MDSKLVAPSLIDAKHRKPLGNLPAIKIGGFKTDSRAVLLNTASVRWAVLGVDISLNDDTTKGLGIAWQAQIYGIGEVEDRKATSKALRKHFPDSKYVRRPVVLKACDGTPYACSYTFKTEFRRRVTYWDDNHIPYPCWETSKPPLKAREHVELLLFLDQLGIAGRMMLHKVRLLHTKEGVVLQKIE